MIGIRPFLILPMLLSLAILVACDERSGASLIASNIEVTSPVPGSPMSAGYLTLRNDSDETIRITAVSSPQFQSVEIHETTLENNVSRMRRLNEVSIAPGDSLEMKRGGVHLMLIKATDTASAITLNLYSDDLLLLTLNTTIATGN